MGAWEICCLTGASALPCSRAHVLITNTERPTRPDRAGDGGIDHDWVRRGNVCTAGPLRTVRNGRFMTGPVGTGWSERVADVSRETPFAGDGICLGGRRGIETPFGGGGDSCARDEEREETGVSRGTYSLGRDGREEAVPRETSERSGRWHAKSVSRGTLSRSGPPMGKDGQRRPPSQKR